MEVEELKNRLRVHIKTGKVYMTSGGTIINCTNNANNQIMISYQLYDNDNKQVFVREIKEFYEKFTSINNFKLTELVFIKESGIGVDHYTALPVYVNDKQYVYCIQHYTSEIEIFINGDSIVNEHLGTIKWSREYKLDDKIAEAKQICRDHFKGLINEVK